MKTGIDWLDDEAARRAAAFSPDVPVRFPVVTICGSMTFYREMLTVAETMTAGGWIVLMPFVAGATGLAKADLDLMHRRKIDLACCIVIVSNDTGYYGTSTSDEIRYADRTAKPIVYARVTDRVIEWRSL